MALSDKKIKRIYIKNGFDDELLGYDIGMSADNVSFILGDDISNVQAVLAEHLGDYVFTKEGVHGIRYWNGNLSVLRIDPETHEPIQPLTWYDIPIGGGVDLNIGPVTNVAVSHDKKEGFLKWTDPNDVLLPDGQILIKWAGTRVIRNMNHPPLNPTDGDLVVETTRAAGQRNIYSDEPYSFGTVQYDTSYHYGLFSYRILSNGDRIYGDGVTVTLKPERIPIQIKPVQANPELLIYDGTRKEPTLNFGDPSRYDISCFETPGGETSGINGRLWINSYKMILVPTDDYIWDVAGVEDHDPLTVDWIITPISIIQPNISNTELTYTRDGEGGVTQGPTISEYDTNIITITDNEKVNVGNYTLTLTLNNPENNIDTNYIWIDGSKLPKTQPWSINQRLVPPPVRGETSNFTYTGKEIHFENTLEHYDPIYMTAEDIVKINAGNYFAKFTLKGNEDIINCKWTNESFSGTIPWSILPALVETPTIESEKIIYDKQSHDIEDSVHYNEQQCTLDEERSTLVATDAGTYRIYFDLNNTEEVQNYKWADESEMSDGYITWNINQAPNENWKLKLNYTDGTLPYNFARGAAIYYDGKIHILGGYLEEYRKAHYSYDGLRWIREDDLPYDFYNGCAVVHNNRIYILGGTESKKLCYSWSDKQDGDIEPNEWIEERELPYEFERGAAVIYNEKVYIIGGYNNNRLLYCWDFQNTHSWDQKKSTPSTSVTYYDHTAVVFNNKILVTSGSGGSNTYRSRIYCYNENTDEWTYSDYPETKVTAAQAGSQRLVVHQNELYFFTNGTAKYLTSSNTWQVITEATASTLKYNLAAISDGQTISILGGSNASDVTSSSVILYNRYYSLLKENNNYFYKIESNIPPYPYQGGKAIVYKDKIHLLGSSTSTEAKNHYSYDGANWVKEADLPYEFYNGCAVVYNNKLYILGGFKEGRIENSNPEINNAQKACYSWDGTEWTQQPILPYPFYNGGAIVYHDKLYIVGGGKDKTDDQKKFNRLNSDGTDWEAVVSDQGGSPITLSFYFSKGGIAIFDDKLCIIMSNIIYEWDENQLSFIQRSTIDTAFAANHIVLNYKNRLHFLQGTAHNSYINNASIFESTLPTDETTASGNQAVIYKDRILFLGTNNLYIFHYTCPVWDSYGKIYINTVEQKAFCNDVIEIENNLGTDNISLVVEERDGYTISNYCEIKKKDGSDNSFIFNLKGVLLESVKKNGIENLKATIQIPGGKNYLDSVKSFPITILGIDSSENTKWKNIDDKQLESMIMAKDYRDNQNHKLQVIDLDSPSGIKDFDIMDYWDICSGNTDFKQLALGAPIISLTKSNLNKWIILDFKNIQTEENGEEIPVVVIGMLTMLSTSNTAARTLSIVGSSTASQVTWLNSYAKTICDNCYNKSFELSHLVKNRYNIGTIFLPSEKEMNGNSTSGYDDGSTPYKYYFNEGVPLFDNAKKRQGWANSTGSFTAYWTRTPNNADPTQYMYIKTDGKIDNDADSAAKGYSLITCI